MKKIFLFISTVAFMSVLFCVSVFSADAVLIDNGCYSDDSNIVWSFYDDGSLIVEGDGAIASFTDSSQVPYLQRFKSGEVKNLIIKDGITEIGDYAFYGCSAENIEIASSVRKIGIYAFYGTETAESLVLSKNVRSIGESAFACSSKLTVTVDSENDYFTNDEYGILYDYAKTEIIFCPAESLLDDYVFPLTVIEITDNAFNGAISLKEITLPKSLQVIGENAFRGCTNLEKLVLNNQIRLIKDGAFEGCDNLKDVYYCGSEKSLYEVVMENCGLSMTDIVCGYCQHDVTVITDGLSASCNSPGYSEGEICSGCNAFIVPREIITVPHSDNDTDGNCDICNEEYCEVIASGFCCEYDDGVFWVLYDNEILRICGNGEMKNYSPYGASFYRYCDSITKLIIGDGVLSVGANAFYDFYRLKTVTGGENVKTVGESAFEGAVLLSRIDGFSSLETVEKGAFRNCALKELDFALNLKTIGSESFYGCEFKSVKLSDCVEGIGERAFYSCIDLEDVFIGEKVLSIGENAFGHCTSLCDITVNGFNSKYCDVDGVLFNKMRTELIRYPSASSQKVYQLPENVKEISFGAFSESENLELIVLNDGLVTIGDYAFSSCSSVSEAEIPYGVEKVGKGAFSYCTQLQSLVVPDSVTVIGDFAFSYCTSLKSAILPYGVSKISQGAFFHCDSLETVTIGTSVKEIGKSAFGLCENLGIVFCEGSDESLFGITIDEFDNEYFITAPKHFSFHTVKEYNEVQPLCIYDGYTKGTYCVKCEYWLSGHKTIEAEYYEHSFGEYTLHKPSTCTEMGEERAYCTRGCGEYISRTVDYAAHKYTASVTLPSCTEIGYTKYTCTCGDSYEADYNDKTSHSLTDYVVITASSCTVAGKERAKCINCSYYIDRNLPLKSHTYSLTSVIKPTCFSSGYSVYSCSCKKSYRADEKAALGHNFSNTFTTDIKATCTSAGSKSRHCTRCDAKYQATAIGRLTHSYGNVVTGATLSENGKISKTCSLCGNIKSTSKIYRIKSVTLSETSYIYDGKTKKPSVTIKDSKGNILVEGTDYTVNQSGRKAIGKYSVTVKFIGKYSGTKTLTFQIVPKNVTNFADKPSIKSVKLSWNKVKGATGYRIYYYNSKTKKYEAIRDTKNLSYTVSKTDGKEIKSGTDYKFAVRAYKEVNGSKIFSLKKTTLKTATKPAKASLKSASLSSGQITVKWKKMNCDGYELVYATNKSFSSRKTVTVKNPSTVKCKLKGIQRGKTYYIKIRGYKTIDGEKVYGYFSDVKTVKIR